MLSKALKTYSLIKHLGLRWCLYRLWWSVEKKTGKYFRSTQSQPYAEANAADHGTLLPELFSHDPGMSHAAVALADKVLSGEFLLFSHHSIPTGEMPDWHRAWLNSDQAPSSDSRDETTEALLHWTQYNDFSDVDIKLIWELNRFTWSYALGRAFTATGEERYAERFWVLFEDWLDRNPPDLGVNWMCGQEASFRLFAVTFAVHALKDAAATSESRKDAYFAFVVRTGERIAHHIRYGLSQSNNHGISECVGLITAGCLLPQRRSSEAWIRSGLKYLKGQLDQLVYPDGGFSQHAANYHRVMLHDLSWCCMILKQSDRKVPDGLIQSGQRAVAFLADIMDPDTGKVPMYGPNDGANVLALSHTDYLDFRPAVQSGAVAFFEERWLPEGPWDDEAKWLFGPSQFPKAITPREWSPSKRWPMAGCAQGRSGDFKYFFRCPTQFRHRPSHADMLGLCLDWRGQSIVIDPGTYSYNSKGPISSSLKLAKVHSTVTFDRQEPMGQASRFLFLPWPKGQVQDSLPHAIEATHDAWKRRGIEHHRNITGTEPDGLRVTDTFQCSKETHARLHWLIGDYPYEWDAEASWMVVRTEKGNVRISWEVPRGAEVTLVRADEASDRGWTSPYYAYKEPALSLAIEFSILDTCSIKTEFRASEEG